MDDVAVGVFGGSGLYQLLDEVERIEVHTPFGQPSAPVAVGVMPGDPHARRVAFVPRHGDNHEIPPHRINYRANLWAFRELGVQRVIAPCASGSLQAEILPGDLVVCDQFVDRTSARAATFFDGPLVHHVPMATPYCEELRSVVVGAARQRNANVHERGTAVVVEGPRFSTRAESQWFRSCGWHVVNMTQYPEVVLARELGMCYAALAIVTDYDAALDDIAGATPVTQDEVFAIFSANLPLVKGLIEATVRALPDGRTCTCAHAMSGVEPLIDVGATR